MIDLKHGNCLEVLRGMPDNSVDAVVTDPPYGLSFMGKKWDYDVPSVELWAECLRVLKPGGHLLAFAGTRTQHRMAVRIEDAGFEIRDMIAWVYGSGFPKSLDVSKAVDKLNGREFEGRYELGRHIRECREKLGISRKEVNARFNAAAICNHWEAQDRNNALPPTPAHWEILKNWLGCDRKYDALVDRIGAEREVVGQQRGNMLAVAPGQDNDRSATTLDITAPATEAARQWQGWGTALKPALEPITVARKPLIGTVADNVMAHGTGALNLDACRVVETVETWPSSRAKPADGHPNALYTHRLGGQAEIQTVGTGPTPPGRWPANLIHDGSEEVLEAFPQAKGQQGAGTGEEPSSKTNAVYGQFNGRPATTPRGDTGSAARFFYCAKASKSDRGAENVHPTVKPTDLMRYLCRLVTPPGGVVLDPFMGSGSTGKAAVLEGFRFIGIEREAEYVEIARARIKAVAGIFYATDAS
jgi:DNA modification methylase